MDAPQTLSVIIPTLDGEALLRAHLPELLKELKACPSTSEVILADDGSSDGTSAFISSLGGDIRIVRNRGARGFGRNCNNAAKQARYDLLFFLNNDVKVTPGVVSKLGRHFAAPDVFAVSPSSIIQRPTGPFAEMPTRPMWRNGVVLACQHATPPVPPASGVQKTFHASGGYSMVRKSMFEALGGFDEIYDPFYWEDLDLCISAARCGWRVLHDASATIYHMHQATIGKHFARHVIERISWRNIFLFNWKHLSDEHVYDVQLPRLMQENDSLLHKDMAALAGFLDALHLYPELRQRKRAFEPKTKWHLEEIVRIDDAEGTLWFKEEAKPC